MVVVVGDVVVVVVPVGDTVVRRGGRVLVVKEGFRPMVGHAIVGREGVNEWVGPTTHRRQIAATHRWTAPIMLLVGCGCGGSVVGVAVGGNCKGFIMTVPASDED